MERAAVRISLTKRSGTSSNRQSRPNGRPPISEKTLRFLREGYDAGFTTTRAAEMALVHRNTAINYFRHFKVADDLLSEAMSKLTVQAVE